jgi:hypothetical protein
MKILQNNVYLLQEEATRLGVVVHTCHHSTQEAEGGGPQAQDSLDHIVQHCLKKSKEKLKGEGRENKEGEEEEEKE